MNIDFAFWLTIATLVTALLWFLNLWMQKGRSRPQENLAGYVGSFFPVLFLVLVLRSFLFEPFQIPSTSMLPTLHVGDFILVNKYSYGLRLPVWGAKILDVGSPSRGDVIVFVPPHNPRYFIKRLIGLPGDRVIYRNQTLFINGEEVNLRSLYDRKNAPDMLRIFEEELGDTSHLMQLDNRGLSKEGEWVVPGGHYFMLGDNRNLSEDSRYWGFVPEHQIVGKAVAIWMHKESGWHWPTFDRNGRII